jgi:hypothetical protein
MANEKQSAAQRRQADRPRLAHLAYRGNGELQEGSNVIYRHHLGARVSRFFSECNIPLGILDRSRFTGNSVTGTERMKRDMRISHSVIANLRTRLGPRRNFRIADDCQLSGRFSGL